MILGGQPRVALRALVTNFMKIAVAQLSSDLQVKLSLFFAAEFFKSGVYDLAVECYETAISICEADGGDSLKAIKDKAVAMHSIVRSNLHDLISIRYCYIAPMTVSKLLQCLQKIRLSMEGVFSLSSKQQEDYAWLILNSSKLILEISQPLVWLNCGKYITETVLYAAICMDSIINLCTVRHMQFRLKLYTTAFYSALTQGSMDEAAAIFQYATSQCTELKEREELDPPLPDKTVLCIAQCSLDLAVMKFSLDFWKDSDTLSFNTANLEKYYTGQHSELSRSFMDICLCECIRLHYLTSGNNNETYRKRSANVIAAATSVFESSELADSLAQKLSLVGLFELLLVVVVDSVEVATNHGGLVTKICTLAEEIFGQNPTPSVTDYWNDIVLLKKLYGVLRSANLEEKLDALKDLLVSIEDTMFSERAYRKKSFLKKVSIVIWQRVLYPSVQEYLSDFQSDNANSPISNCADALVLLLKTFDAAFLEDPVLYGALSLITAQVLRLNGDLRQSISLLKQSISVIDDHRAASIDIAVHMPDDGRDVLALQRASFSVRAESQDWYHSVKRLGAQAFAGYGIFGLSSGADRSMQSLAEIQADLLSLYFRSELEYAIQQRVTGMRFRSDTANNTILNSASPTKTATIQPAATNTKGKTTTKGSKTIGKATTKNTKAFVTVAAVSEDEDAGIVDIEKLHAAHFLKSYCLHNCYARCLFLLEMARCQRDNEEKCLDCLHEAMKCIEEAEGREQMLKSSFSDHTVITDSNVKYPIVLARSHKFVYVVPVGCRKLSSALYYRILAKERGSGTAVSIYNDDFSGCEKKIFVGNLTHPTQCAVKIGPLRPGELYMFGHVAFNAADKVVGHVSPSSPVVEALNPLPTILLWHLLTQTAEELSVAVNSDLLYKEASLRVCARFFINTPSDLSPVVIGKGINLFLVKESSIAMLAVHQSSPVIIQCFISSFLSHEIQAKRKYDDVGIVNWSMRVHSQLLYLRALGRVATVTRFGMSLRSHELTVRCVHFGYLLVVELIRFDLLHLATFLQSPLTVFAIAMQSIPKRNWQDLEHSLYCHILADLIRVSVLNANLSPAIFILNEFYPEAGSDKATKSSPPPRLLGEYAAVVEVATSSIALTHLTPFLAQSVFALKHNEVIFGLTLLLKILIYFDSTFLLAAL